MRALPALLASSAIVLCVFGCAAPQQDRWARLPPDAVVRTLVLQLAPIDCSYCARAAKRQLLDQPDVIEVEIDVAESQLRIAYTGRGPSAETYRRILHDVDLTLVSAARRDGPARPPSSVPE